MDLRASGRCGWIRRPGNPSPIRIRSSTSTEAHGTIPGIPVFSVGPDRIIISLEQVQSDLWMTQLPEEK